MSQHKPGRIRFRLAELLRDLGYEVTAYDIWEQQGFWRKTSKWGGARWGANEPRATRRSLSSWCTMTDCVRYGIEIVDGDVLSKGGTGA